MFKLDGKDHDEKDLEGAAKIAFANFQLLLNEKNDLLHKLEKNKILSDHYSDKLKSSLTNGLDKQAKNG